MAYQNNSNKPVRVRFAPSPTGRLHVGGARTAIYNWAFARANKGTFILRIEDTDPERSTQENTDVILRAMKWLELDWDEGPIVGGSKGPYFQTQRSETYKQALETLKEKDAVYPCFCTKEELDAKRASAQEKSGAYAGYDQTCRHISPDEAARRIAAGDSHVWRLKVPENHGPIEFDDAVYGHMSFPEDAIDDMIVMRSDGTPTYNFAVVCDDANMGITHVIRGDDHLSNTPKQILIYEALGFDIPLFAHLSMILGSDGKKLSKRHGSASVEEFRDKGYLPDVMVNFLALLGWSLDGETTLISREVLCKEFSLERITKKDAIFDEKKLNWMCGQYIQKMGDSAWFDASLPWLSEAIARGHKAKAGIEIIPTHNPNDPNAPEPELVPLSADELDAAREEALTKRGWFLQIYPLVSERLQHLDELAIKLEYFFWGKNLVLDEKSAKKVLFKSDARADEALCACREILADTTRAWDGKSLEEACKCAGEVLELKPKLLFQPVRVAVCGNMVSPPLFESIELMERKDVIERIDACIELIKTHVEPENE